MTMMSTAGGLLFSGAALAAALSLSQNALSVEAFATPANSRGAARVAAHDGRRCSPTTTTTLYNRADRRKSKKKKRRGLDLDDEEDAAGSPRAAGANEPILLGGGDGGFTTAVPDASPIPLATATTGAPAPSKLERELAGERIEEEGIVGESVTAAASVSDLPLAAGELPPDVTQVVTDPDTGIARIQQGKYVLDKVTGRAVALSSLGPEYRLAQMFPGVPPATLAEHRVDWSAATVPDLVARLRAAATVPLRDEATGREGRGLPPHPRVASAAVDFVLANRDRLGHRMKRALGRLKLRAQSQFKKDEALELRALWKHFLLLEDHVSAPFRQCVLDAEAVVGPNFGNLDVKSYCDGAPYERAANYLVLKSMVAHWEKKYNDALELEKIPDDQGMNFYAQLYTGDPKRYLPDPPIIFRKDEVTRIVGMAQKMCAAFVAEPTLFDDLPPEVRFVETALSISGGTELRRYLLEDFCPANDVDGASLREGLRRLHQSMCNMQIDPYGDFTMTLDNLCAAVDRGTADERDPYEEYISNAAGTSYETNPGFFQTYTFNHDKDSMVRFLDNIKQADEAKADAGDVGRQIKGEAIELFGFNFGGGSGDQTDGKVVEEEDYVVPEERAIGRPHMMGWLELLGKDEEGGDLDETSFEADKWEEVQV